VSAVSAEQVRQAYAARADEYVALLGTVAQNPPEDQELVTTWAAGLTGPVLDAGCGPGHWTAFLHERGIDVQGLDLVPEFVAGAARRFPDVTFGVGDLSELPVGDGELAGILSWYSLIHTAPEHVPARLAEFARALRPGGSLLIGFVRGDVLAPFDHRVVTAWFWPVEAMGQELETAGFEVVETHTRTDPGKRPHAALIARRRPA
jgi:trans-aconitate methyltransferase